MSLKAWHRRIEHTLSAAEAPPVLTRDLIDRFARSARDGRPVPASTLSLWIAREADAGKLERVQRGLYLNRFHFVYGTLADAVPFFHKDAVVSLNTVLGDAGVLNNPSNTVTAVVPLDAGSPMPHLGRKTTAAGRLHFFGLPRRILQAGETRDRLEAEHRYTHARATPEKALIDWLYLARSPRSKRTMPVRADVDLTLLKQARLRRLAKATGLVDELKSWLELEPA